ncbi:hypothetical protein KI387_007377, partial [Taxus chinensis]
MEECDETVLKSLVDFFRQTVGDKLAEPDYEFKEHKNAERNHWTYIVEVILGIDKYAGDPVHVNVDRPEPEEDEVARSNRRQQELINEEEARKASQEKALNTTTPANKPRKKHKKKAKKAKKEVDIGRDEGDQDASGGGDEKDKDDPGFRIEDGMGVPMGIENQGNTCYMNAAFQFLLRPLGFDWFYKDKEEAAENGEDTLDVVKEFHQIWKLILTNKSQNGRRAIDPRVGNLLGGLQRAWASYANLQRGFDPNSAQDAEEFLTFIFQRALMERRCKTAFNVETAQLHVCGTCGTDMPPDIAPAQPILFLAYLSEITHRHTLEEFLAHMFCEGNRFERRRICNCGKDDMITRSVLWKTSDFLIIKLFRRNSVGHKFLYTLDNIPRILDLKRYFAPRMAPENARYKLYAMIAHVGDNWNYGHYITAVLDDTSKTWFLFSDETVAKLSDLQDPVGNKACELLYKKMADDEEVEEEEGQINVEESGSTEFCVDVGRENNSNELRETETVKQSEPVVEQRPRFQIVNVGLHEIIIPTEDVHEPQDANRVEILNQPAADENIWSPKKSETGEVRSESRNEPQDANRFEILNQTIADKIICSSEKSETDETQSHSTNENWGDRSEEDPRYETAISVLCELFLQKRWDKWKADPNTWVYDSNSETGAVRIGTRLEKEGSGQVSMEDSEHEPKENVGTAEDELVLHQIQQELSEGTSKDNENAARKEDKTMPSPSDSSDIPTILQELGYHENQFVNENSSGMENIKQGGGGEDINSECEQGRAEDTNSECTGQKGGEDHTNSEFEQGTEDTNCGCEQGGGEITDSVYEQEGGEDANSECEDPIKTESPKKNPPVETENKRLVTIDADQSEKLGYFSGNKESSDDAPRIEKQGFGETPCSEGVPSYDPERLSIVDQEISDLQMVQSSYALSMPNLSELLRQMEISSASGSAIEITAGNVVAWMLSSVAGYGRRPQQDSATATTSNTLFVGAGTVPSMSFQLPDLSELLRQMGISIIVNEHGKRPPQALLEAGSVADSAGSQLEMLVKLMNEHRAEVRTSLAEVRTSLAEVHTSMADMNDRTAQLTDSVRELIAQHKVLSDAVARLERDSLHRQGRNGEDSGA